MLPTRFRYIAVEGPIGVGKTSLARRLADATGGDLLLENPDDNPFLARFYSDKKRYALQTQLFFLLARTEQTARLSQAGLFSPVTIADFLIEKDPLFARLNLDDTEFALYQKIHADMAPKAPTPDLVIYLQAPSSLLAERVRRRGRIYERNLPESYLADLARLYSEFFYHYDSSPLLIVNSENLNFADKTADFELLLKRLNDMRGAREFFNLGT
ncbi:MAG: deoxynucleoside kinase [Hydrogenophilales bacterium]|nr:deoxynucleoside kinase [Hydrogenophilales bacterium]